jgi:ATP-dependent Clp protease ATP-binding subunit ClpC
MSLFRQGLFNPNSFPDQRTTQVLSKIGSLASDLIRPSDIFATGMAEDALLAQTVLQLLPDPATRARILALLREFHAKKILNVGPLVRGSFSPECIQVFEEFERTFDPSDKDLFSLGLEILMHCCLLAFTSEEKKRWPELDTKLLATQLAQRVISISAKASFETMPSPTQPFQFPEHLIACDDLTYYSANSGDSAHYPYDGVQVYEQLFDRICRVLHRREANHLFLVGERGVGATFIPVELARRAIRGQIRFLAKCRIIRINVHLIPPDESRQRLLAILHFVAQFQDIILCIEGLATLLRGDRGEAHKQLLLSYLADARIRIIGILTPRDYEDLAADDPDYTEFFSRIDVPEPDVPTAIKLVTHFAQSLAHRYTLDIDASAINAAVRLTADYILSDKLPSKAIRVLRSLCEDFDYERTQNNAPMRPLIAEDVIRTISNLTGVPEETLIGIAGQSDYETGLKDWIIGQDEAVAEVAIELGLIKAGMTDSSKPASVLLFLGQTGTGKTEMAKALAKLYSTTRRLRTYTLGNCVESHSVSTLIGVPPGYVGHDRGGRLIKELNADPYCVVLLDEADKAHPDVLQPLLNVFDEGWIEDQRGVKGYAQNAIFILTTNVGQRMISELSAEGKTAPEIAARMKETLSQIRHTKSDRPVFTPEFLARIKKIIVFKPLTADAMDGIMRKLVRELCELWQTKRGKTLIISNNLVDWLAAEAHQRNEESKGKEGGRIARKLLSDFIESPLQREIARSPDSYRLWPQIEVSVTFKACQEALNQINIPEIRVAFLSSKDMPQ